MTQIATPSTPPLPIRRALRRVDFRLRSARASRGLGMALVLAAAGSALGMAADFAWTLPGPARWAIWACWAATVGAFLALGVLRPLFRGSRWIDLAAVAEKADPRLGERLTGAIALAEEAGHSHGSPALIAALARDAAGHVGEFDPSTVHGARHPGLRLAVGLVAVGLVAAPAVVKPDPFRTLALRFVAPWMDLDRVSWFALDVAPGDKVVAAGSDFKVEAKVTPRFQSKLPLPDSASLEWTDEDGASHKVPMTALASDSSGSSRGFEATVRRLDRSIRYRVSTASARSRSYRASAVEPPKVARLSAEIRPPAYTKKPPFKVEDASKVEALQGSEVALTIRAGSPVRGITVAWPTAPPTGRGGSNEVTLKPSDGGTSATASIVAEVGGTIVLTPRGDLETGLDGLPDNRPLVVRPDAAPTLAVKAPASSVEARPDDVLQLGVAARDDFEVASAELHFEVRSSKSDASKTGQVALKVEGLGTPTARGFASVALREFGVEAGDSVSYRVRVADNLPESRLGPNVTWSDPRTISINAKAEPMASKDDRLRRESFQARLDEIRVANASNRRETEQLRYAADAAQRNGQSWDAGKDADLAAREAEARGVEDKLQLLARDLQADSTFGPLARPTRQAAEVEAEAGRAQLDRARKATDSTKRLAELRQADNRLGTLGHRLDEIRRKFDALAKGDVDRQKLRDLAAREDALAAKAERDDAEKARIAAEQEELRQALEELLAKSPALRSGLLAAQADEAARLARSARALAEKQRAEARKTAESARGADPIREIAQAQKELEDDARRLALDVDEPLAENGRSRLDVDSVGRAVIPIERGDLPDAVRHLENSENSLRHLARDVEDVPLDPKALARRLARRQELLANDVAATLGEARRKDDLPLDEKAALVERSKALVDRQKEIAGLAAALVAPEAQKGAAREAAQATAKALDNLQNLKPRDSENAQNDARRALNQLAEALVDPNQKRDEARRKVDEAKRKEEEVLRDVARHVAETQPRADQLNPEARAAAELAEKVAPLIPKEKEAAEALAKLEVEPRLAPQRDRAAADAARLAEALQLVKDQAPPKVPEGKPVPPSRWNVLGPFPTINPRVPFDPAKAVDLGAKITVDGKTYEWKPAPFEGGDEGRINLGQIFNQNDNQAAFAVAEVVSPRRRKVPLSIGSDDTLIVWVNGKPVFEHNASRAFQAGQDKAEVELMEGVNRLAIRCGNGNGIWQFAVNLPPPPPEGFEPEKAERLREALESARVDAQASLYRLEEKMNGRTPADDVAEELAREQRAAAEDIAREEGKAPEADPSAREQAALDRRRLATAIRNLPLAPEAPALHAEAARLAEAAAAPDATPEAARAAAEAAEALARRVGDGLAPRELAAALAKAERALDAPDPRRDPAQVAERQKAIAAELTHPASNAERPAAAPPKSPASEKAEQAVRAAADAAAQGTKPETSKANAAPASVAEARGNAAEALEKMAADPALGPDPSNRKAEPSGRKPAELAGVPADPALGLGPEKAARAADLARRQRQLRERLLTAMADRIGPQEDLRRESQQLGRELAALRDWAKEFNARAQWQVQSAAATAGEEAPKFMEKGAEHLGQGKLDQAKDAQRMAADLIERAAREAEDFAVNLRAEGAEARESPEGNAAQESAPNGLANARQSLRDLARKLGQGPADPSAAKSAAPGMRQAADDLRNAARTPAEGPTAPGLGEPSPDDPNPTAKPAGTADADLAALQDLVRKKTGRQWGELPGHLRTEILQLSKGRYRDDYARLIQLYFKEIAAGASKPKP